MLKVMREAEPSPAIRDIAQGDFSRMGKENELFTVDAQGKPTAPFVLLQSAQANWFLSDGLNAFRRTATGL